MRLEDLDAVMAIEGNSFPTPWPRSGYEHELTRNEHAHYQVLLGPDEQIIGYAGQWLVAGEGHISIMAVDPAWRGHGLGEMLLSALIQQAQEAGASASRWGAHQQPDRAGALPEISVGEADPALYRHRLDALVMTLG